MLNSGISLGLFPNISLWIIIVILTALTVYALKMRELFGRVGLFLVIAGGLGNLISRIRYGAVVDDLSFFGIFYNNIWDYLITIGVAIFLIQVIRKKA